jgi:hypothetical protein
MVGDIRRQILFLLSQAEAFECRTKQDLPAPGRRFAPRKTYFLEIRNANAKDPSG